MPNNGPQPSLKERCRNAEMNILVLHPDRAVADEITEVLQEYGFNALAVTDAIDALEHVENLRFDVAIVSTEIQWAEVGELLFHASNHWLEIMLLGTLEASEGCLPLPCEVRELVLQVGQAVERSRVTAYHIGEAWHSAWDGEAGHNIYEPSPLTQEEWDTKIEELKKLLAARKRPGYGGLDSRFGLQS